MPVLLIIRENNEEKRAKLTARPLILGRSSKCHVQIQDQMCSGKHCAFKLSEQFNVLVKDLGSTNGTYLNDGQIMDSHLMLDDIIKIGECEVYIDRSELSPKEKSILSRDEPTAQIKFVNLTTKKKTVRPSQVVRSKQQSKTPPQSPKKFFPEASENKNVEAEKPVEDSSKKKVDNNTTTNTSLKDRLAAKGKQISQTKPIQQTEVPNERQIDLEESSGDTQFIKLDKGTGTSKKKLKSSFASKIKKVFKK